MSGSAEDGSFDPQDASDLAAERALAAKLRETAPELAAYLDAWIKNGHSETGSIEVFLGRLIKEASTALEREKAELALVLAAPHDEAVLVLDSMGTITGVCKHCTDVLGREKEKLIGRSIDAVLAEPFLAIDVSAAEMAKAARGERVRTVRTQRREDGSTFESSHTVAALIGPMGELKGFARRIEDISERRAHEIHIERLSDSVALLMRRTE